MLPRTARLRQTICQGCKTPCQRSLDGKVNYADPSVACELGIWHALDGHGVVSHTNPTSRRIRVKGYDGSHKWAALRQKAILNAITDEWLDVWEADLPTSVCGCKIHWQADRASNPVPTTNQFAWYVARHNTVNARLGHPLWTLAEATAKWAKC